MFAGTGWELESLSPPNTPFFVANPNVNVKLSTGEAIRVSAHHPIPDYANVLFLNAEQLAFFDHVLARAGGTERRQPTGIMEVSPTSQPEVPSRCWRSCRSFFRRGPATGAGG